LSSTKPSRIDEVIEIVHDRVTNDMRNVLNQPFTRDEVHATLKSMKPTTAPSPDGMPTIFFK